MQVLHGPPVITPATPAGLPHQRDHSLLLGPTLFSGNVGEICGTEAAIAGEERDAQTMRADFPIHGVGDGLEVSKESYAALERGEFAGSYWVKSGVLERATKILSTSLEGGTMGFSRCQGIAPKPILELMGLKGPYTPTKADLTPTANGIPRHEQRVLLVVCSAYAILLAS
jgi:hypothetical protein